jgi:hypothetical protein
MYRHGIGAEARRTVCTLSQLQNIFWLVFGQVQGNGVQTQVHGPKLKHSLNSDSEKSFTKMLRARATRYSESSPWNLIKTLKRLIQSIRINRGSRIMEPFNDSMVAF